MKQCLAVLVFFTLGEPRLLNVMEAFFELLKALRLNQQRCDDVCDTPTERKVQVSTVSQTLCWILSFGIVPNIRF